MEKPIRILHVFAQMNRGGAESMIMNLYRNIDRSEIQFDFMVHTRERCAFDEEINSLGGKIYNVPRYRGSNHYAYKKTWRNFFKEHGEYCILHGHVRSTATIYLAVARAYGIKTIVHSHSTSSRGNKIQQVIKNIMQLPIRYQADYLFSCSHDAGRWLFGDRVIYKQNYTIINNAIDVNKYIFNEKKRNLVRKSLAVENKFTLGHIGSFTSPKNHEFLIDVFYEIKKRKKESVLLLIGDGNLREAIEDKVKKLGLSDSVIFTGVRSDVNDLLQGIDVVLFPSLFEGLPVSLIEAQANGLVCIISDRITDKVKLTEQVEFISLNKTPEYWAEQVLKYSKGYNRKNTYKEIRNAGYDVKENAIWLENFYTKILNL
jgi:glycosyltransferase involved in cell wall biosynthesis